MAVFKITASDVCVFPVITVYKLYCAAFFVAKCEMDSLIGRQHHLDEDASKVVYEGRFT